MHRIDSLTSTPNHQFTEGDPLTGVLPTELSFDWLSSIQEELSNAVEVSNQELDHDNSNQLLQSIISLEVIKPQAIKVNIPEGINNTPIPLPLMFDPTVSQAYFFKCCCISRPSSYPPNLSEWAAYFNPRLRAWQLKRFDFPGPLESQLELRMIRNQLNYLKHDALPAHLFIYDLKEFKKQPDAQN